MSDQRTSLSETHIQISLETVEKGNEALRKCFKTDELPHAFTASIVFEAMWNNICSEERAALKKAAVEAAVKREADLIDRGTPTDAKSLRSFILAVIDSHEQRRG